MQSASIQNRQSKIPNSMTLANQPTSPILPLENGDRLIRVKLERRYQAMPKQIKANIYGLL